MAIDDTVVTEQATHEDMDGRDLRGCPVMHEDFSRAREVGSHWEWADELRESAPVYFNTFAQGYWIFTRHDAVRDIYKTPEIFSSESFTPWDPEPIYRFVPTQIDAPDHIKYRRILNPWFSPRAIDDAEPMMRELCRKLVERTARAGSCNLVNEFALRFPTEAFLAVIGVDTADADMFVRWVEDFFAGFGGDTEKLEPMAKALDGIREYWVEALADRRDDAEPREGDLASYLMHASFDDRPLTDTEILDMLTVLVLAGLDTTRAELGYMFRHLATHPEHRASTDRRSAADPLGRRRGPSLLHDHLRRRPQGHPRHRVPRRAAEAWRHGLRARVGGKPRPARLRAGRTSSSPIASATTTWASRAGRTAASVSTWRGGRCRSRSRSGCG